MFIRSRWAGSFCLLFVYCCAGAQAEGKRWALIHSAFSQQDSSSARKGSHCMDLIQNQGESDVDCGGSKCPKCDNGMKCREDSDCMSNTCKNKKCSYFESCDDDVKNQDETDVDCGGIKCPACENSKMCKEHSDCDNGFCERKKCVTVESCEDNIKNQDESDVDCGGIHCPRCEAAKACKAGCDCISDSCVNNTCAVAEWCMDNVQNQDETDVDCGGDKCPKCDVLKHCKADCDCISDVCEDNRCITLQTENSTVTPSVTSTTTADIVTTTSPNSTKPSVDWTTTSSSMNTVSTTTPVITSTKSSTTSATVTSTFTTVSSTTSTMSTNKTCSSNSIVWKGYTWCLRNDKNTGRGQNNYAASNVWIDDKDQLRLRITNMSGAWTSAELYTTHRFSFGTFQWQVQALLSGLDPNVVLSLYTYGPTTAAEDGTNQITIDFTRWGVGASSAPNMFYNIWPAKTYGPRSGTSFLHNQRSMYSTHRFKWSSMGVIFQSLTGFRNDDTNLFHSWRSPASFTPAAPQTTAPVHMNLWIYSSRNEDRFPSDGKPVEVIIHDFIYRPLPSSARLATTAHDTLLITLSALLPVCSLILSRAVF